MDAQSHINSALKKLDTIYFCLGLSYDISNITKRERIKRRFVYVFNFIWLNTDVLGAVVWFIDGIKNGKAFVEFTYIAPCIIFSFFGNYRAYTLVRNEKKTSEIITNLRRLERTGLIKDLKMRDEIFRKETKFLHTVINVSNVLNVILIIIFFVSPLVVILAKYLKTNQWDLLLPFLIIYPFDSHDIRYWPYVYLHQSWSECIAILQICGVDHLLYICCMFIQIQFRLLQYQFSKINNDLTDEDILKAEFKKLIKWHRELIRLSIILEQVYSKSTLMNLVCSSTLLCLTGFNVVAIDNKALSIMFLVFLSASLLQIFFVCYFGDLLMRTSSGVGDAIYESKWCKNDFVFARNLHIVQTRSLRPCKLTAFGFGDMNLRTFMSILSTAWSYFALLKTVYNPSRT